MKWAASLSDKKNRKEHGYFMAEGVKLTREAFEAGLPVEWCIVSENTKKEAIDFLDEYKDDPKYEKCKIVNGLFRPIVAPVQLLLKRRN